MSSLNLALSTVFAAVACRSYYKTSSPFVKMASRLVLLLGVLLVIGVYFCVQHFENGNLEVFSMNPEQRRLLFGQE